jgi:hypothetical protein
MEDKALVFAPMKVLMGLMVGLTTVYRGEQALMLFIAGCLHGMKPTSLEIGSVHAPAPGFQFQKVLV